MLSKKSLKILLTAGLLLAVCFFIPAISFAQVKWVNVDADYAPLPSTVQVFKTTDSLDGKPFIAYYVKAKLKDKSLDFTTDTTLGRRLTPLKFYEKNNNPLLVVNCTFFSFETNRSLNVVIKDGKLVGYNIHSIAMRGKDTFQYRHPFGSAIGIDKKRVADVAWLYTDSTLKFPYAAQEEMTANKDSVSHLDFWQIQSMKYSLDLPFDGNLDKVKWKQSFKKWKVKTAVGGGPVLIQNGKIRITNEEELKFTGKAISDKHPRTCMGYTKDGYLIIMVIQGRFPGIAEGATLEQEAKLLIDIGCVEALNLDGGGSSCMLINGKETIKVSDKTGERPVPAVFLIKQK
ncbi:MAG: phosphodiester glycosidase family protein [Ferruginibacter sp.]